MHPERQHSGAAPRDRRGHLTGLIIAVHLLLVLVMATIGFDTLFDITGARQSNGVVAFADAASTLFLVPFRGMFTIDSDILTAAVAIIAYLVLDAAVTSVLRWTGSHRAQGNA